MGKSPKSLDPRTLAKLKGLHLRAQHIVEGYVAGLHRSPYHGFSIEFAEHREYAPGDDLRYVDWKVFGRTDKFYLKQYDDETNLICHIVLDVSESMSYRGPNAPSPSLSTLSPLAAALAWLVLQQQDAIGLVTFDEQIRASVRASSNPSHLQQIFQVLESAPLEAETAAGPIFHELAERMKKRSVVVILSDLFDDVDSIMAGLKHFRHRRHDVIVFHVLDPAEAGFLVLAAHHLSRLGADAQSDGRSPFLAQSIRERDRGISADLEDRLPTHRDRLPTAAHRSSARHRAIQLPRLADGTRERVRGEGVRG